MLGVSAGGINVENYWRLWGESDGKYNINVMVWVLDVCPDVRCSGRLILSACSVNLETTSDLIRPKGKGRDNPPLQGRDIQAFQHLQQSS